MRAPEHALRIGRGTGPTIALAAEIARWHDPVIANSQWGEPLADVRGLKRKYLVVIDDTEECDRAVTFAANRIKHSNGSIILMAVIEPGEFQHWLGVENIMRAEAKEEAERLLDIRRRRIAQIGDIKVQTVVREGRPAEEVEKLILEDRDIAILILAAGTSKDGPGPLVSAFTQRGANFLPIPVSIVPGSLSDEEIAALS